MFAAARKPVEKRSGLAFEVAGARLVGLSCGALWWEDERVLVVSDLHLEKGSAYAARGQMLPPYDTCAALNRIAAVMERMAPRTVISLGDSFHDRGGRLRMAAANVAQLRKLTAAADWVWIEGNHDPRPPEDLGGRATDVLRLGPLTFRHEPTQGQAPGEIAGHLHPCAVVMGRARWVRARCFAGDGERLVMPSYGALTGGLNVRDPAFASLFPKGLIAGVIGLDGVYAAGLASLAG